MDSDFFSECVEVMELWTRVNDDGDVQLLGREPHVAIKIPRSTWVMIADYVSRMHSKDPMSKPPLRVTF